ncbi:putative 2-dehydropantoate 2-reductase [Paenibacillus sp. J31TS4]|uniref:ketopantoate reductase family protein n=1 Tax=Paenibacillus sp. J31TS4 TaxID=2807195 RepID=UPI001B2296E1|nr:2-dehydropantoate 2-reductase [Paenibacillus sp. J31TS4]GIP39660.1 putative 2-dehydropantoate 2-reductase [Paenibacillus sp. J31TS4]
MNIRVVGGGSLGLLLAGRLAAGGSSVELLCRTTSQAEFLRRDKLRLIEGEEAREISLSVLADEEERTEERKPDWLLVTVKQKAITPAFAQRLAAMCGPGTRVACFQNGVGHTEVLAGALGAERLFAAVTTEGARRTGPREVEHTGRGITWLGPVYPEALRHVPDGPEAGLLQRLREAGFEAAYAPRMEQLVWNKLIINAVINPLTAVLNVRNGELLERPELLEAMRALYKEAAGIAGCQGIIVSENLWEQVTGVCLRTARNQSSMLQDVLAGRETEIEAITGSLLRLGAECGFEAKSHQLLYWLVKAKSASKTIDVKI